MSRAVMQQALDALNRLYNDSEIMVTHDQHRAMKAAITALRVALAEPQTTHWEGCEAVHPECRTTPRKPLTEEEIVRLMVGEDRVQLLYSKPGDPYFSEFAEGAIRELVESGRAIERAHGIGEQHGS